MQGISNLNDLKNKRILLRTDLDVPIDNDGIIVETFRVEKQKETIDFLINKGAKVFMVAHSNYVTSFESMVGQLQELLGYPIKFIKDINKVSQTQIDNG